MAQNHAERQLLRAGPPRARRPVQPGRQQRLQRRAPAQLQQRRAEGRVRLGDAARPRRLGRTAASTRSLRNNIGGVPTSTSVGGTTYGGTGVYGGAGRRRVGRAARRRPQLLVLRQLRLAQPRQLRSGRPPLDAGLLPRRVPAQLHAWCATAATSCGRRRSSTACAPATASRPAASSSTASASWPAPTQAATAQRAAADRRRTRAMQQHRRSTSRGCATMGEKLGWRRARTSSSAIAVRDPAGTNYSPYTFPNPSLAQVGINQPLNKPVLDHIDVIRGLVTGYKDAGHAGLRGRVAAQHDWLQADGTTADLGRCPPAAKNTTRRGHPRRSTAAAHAWTTVTSFVDGTDVPGDDVPHPGGGGLAVRPPARHEHAAGGAVRDRRQRQPAGGRLHQRAATRPGCASPARRRTSRRPASSTAARHHLATATSRRRAPARSPARRRSRSTSRPGRTSGSTATRSTSRSRARRWSPASSNASRATVTVRRRRAATRGADSVICRRSHHVDSAV